MTLIHFFFCSSSFPLFFSATGKDKLKTIQIEEEADKDRQKYQKKIASQEKVADDRVKARLEERKRSREK